MITFDVPEALLLLLFIPLGLYVRHLWPGRGGRILLTHRMWEGASVPKRIRLSGVLFFVAQLLYWLCWIVLIVSLAGPAQTRRERTFLNRGVDFMVVLDSSVSMAAQDFNPLSRFEVAVRTIEEFIEGRENDAIGLVGFGSDAGIKSPPTLRTNYTLDALKSMHVLEFGDGTAIGLGLSVALLHLRESSAERKAIILLTDGENNSGEINPISAVSIARQLGVPIYAIGVGSKADRIPIEYLEPDSGKTFRGFYQGTFNERLLQQIAEESGGRYFEANSTGSLRGILRAIDAQESSENRVYIQVVREELHTPLLLLALGFLVASVFIRKVLLGELL